MLRTGELVVPEGLSEQFSMLQAAQKGHPARPQGVGRLRRTREGTSQGDTGLRTMLGAFFSRLLGFDGDVDKCRHTIRPLLVRHP